MARNTTIETLHQAMLKSGAFVALLFIIEAVDLFLMAISHSTASRLALYGIVPRTLGGLPGILFSPLLHASAAHLLANALPLFILLTVLFWDRHYYPAETLALIWLGSGIGTWLIGRSHSVHVGASGLIYGLVTYFIVAGCLMGRWRAVIAAVLVLIFYGGIFFGVLPQAGPISWEGHLSGAIAGLWVAHRNHG
ncbi:MAG: rhomboid family intramembrane serine protease [Candidatus Omnitrophica bacterium]|nr:rhomboid family intramembrane serine protease [Candidatus Omnitrophota bacterium]